ncbi:MAG: 3-hydroxyacyl-ACP dehydratase FabZ [Erysipelotrichaceae bacterium]
MILNSIQIQEIIPHRYPMLLVDAILEMDETTIVGKKNVSVNEAFFCGHFPQEHVMPGVLIVEALAQVGAVLLLSQEQHRGKIAYFAGIDKVRFKKKVIPGDTMILKVTSKEVRHGLGFAKGEAYVDGQLAVVADLMFHV